MHIGQANLRCPFLPIHFFLFLLSFLLFLPPSHIPSFFGTPLSLHGPFLPSSLSSCVYISYETINPPPPHAPPRTSCLSEGHSCGTERRQSSHEEFSMEGVQLHLQASLLVLHLPEGIRHHPLTSQGKRLVSGRSCSSMLSTYCPVCHNDMHCLCHSDTGRTVLLVRVLHFEK